MAQAILRALNGAELKIVIPACPEHEDRVKSIKATWWRDDLCVLFPSDQEGREYLGKKYKSICVTFKDENYVFICDTDTYVHVPRLLTSGFSAHDYIGHQRQEWKSCYAFGGPGFWLSKRALNKLAYADWSKFTAPGMDFAADMTIGAILDEYAPLKDDRRYALYEEVLPSNQIITKHLTSRAPFRPEMMLEAHKAAYASVQGAH